MVRVIGRPESEVAVGVKGAARSVAMAGKVIV
jgi:hypothetical protein